VYFLPVLLLLIHKRDGEEEYQMKVLVAYATAHGSTAEVAERISSALQKHGINATAANVQNLASVEGYDAFILGTAVHAGTWLPDMTAFVKRTAPGMGLKPIYFWVNCIRILEQFGYDHVVEYYMVPEVLSGLNVREKIAFAGKLRLDEVDWNERWTLAARYDGATWPSNFDGDFRDWDKISEWANKIAAELVATKS